jgi:hypothetical protein
VRGSQINGQDILCDRKRQVINYPGEKLNFVILDEPSYREGNGERFIVVPEARSTHSQLARGGPVKYSGEMIVENGRIVSWNSKAGHYRQPSLQKVEKWHDAIPDMARSAVQDKYRVVTRISEMLKHGICSTRCEHRLS